MKVKIAIYSSALACAVFLSGCGLSETKTEITETIFDTSGTGLTEQTTWDGTTSYTDFTEESEPPASTELETKEMSSPALSAKLIGWGLGKARDKQNRPIDALNAQLKYGAFDAVFINPDAKKKLYLTFDEGYENGYTSQILDVLKEKGIKAVFFVTYDYCKDAPDLVQRMIEEGHVVGNHSYTHTSFPACSDKEVREEITYLHEYVEKNFNYTMKLIRFPKGEFSEKTLAIAQEYGYTTVFWSFAHVDWDTNDQPTAKEAFDKITAATHSGAIYLLHAVSKANADCLSDVIDYWKNNGIAVSDPMELIDI